MERIDRLTAFLGKGIQLSDAVSIYSPTIDEVSTIGEMQYHLYLVLCSFDKEFIVKKLLQFSDEKYEEIVMFDDYDVITHSKLISQEVANALSFFCRNKVEFSFDTKTFVCNDEQFLTKENYITIVNIIKELNGIQVEEKKQKRFRNQKAKEMYEKLTKLRKKHKDDGLELKDILSILCSAEGNGINIFNVGDLSVYQVYEHFERLNINESHKRLIRVWANGLLDKETKVPEWITKSKL